MVITQLISLPKLATPKMDGLKCCDNIYKEHSYSKDMTHLITGSIERYIVGDRFHEKAGGHKKPHASFTILTSAQS